MKIIRQGNHEEEQHHGADECAPFAPSRVTPKAGLSRPPGAPCDHACQRDQDPKTIEKYLHFPLCIGARCTALLAPKNTMSLPQSIYYAKGPPGNRLQDTYIRTVSRVKGLAASSSNPSKPQNMLWL